MAFVIIPAAAAAIALLLLPYAIARFRKHPDNAKILRVNLLGGWTVLGWLACLAWACSKFGHKKIAG